MSLRYNKATNQTFKRRVVGDIHTWDLRADSRLKGPVDLENIEENAVEPLNNLR